MRVTIACPESMMNDANAWCTAISHIPGDKHTFQHPVWVDTHGNKYAAASAIVPNDWLDNLTTTLTRPQWDTQPYDINMTGAARTQEHMRVTNTPATPTQITIMTHTNGRKALQAMQLTHADAT